MNGRTEASFHTDIDTPFRDCISAVKRIVEDLQTGILPTRVLFKEEIEMLVSQGNTCSDWNNFLVTDGFIPNFIHHSDFSGICIVGRFRGISLHSSEGFSLQSGIFRSKIHNSILFDDCAVYNAGIVSNYVIREKAIVFGSSLVNAGNTMFGCGTVVCMGPESGGRELHSFADMTMDYAHTVTVNSGNGMFQYRHKEFVKKYCEAVFSPFGIVDKEAHILEVPFVKGSYIGPFCRIEGAELIDNSCILGAADEQTTVSSGSIVKNSIVQWGCDVSGQAIIETSVLLEHVRSERQGKVLSSVIGPNSSVAEGEVTASLVGPFVGFHHQALLIAAIWPDGKGNVGYGANVGSNHTSRAPDQEIWPGEGMFFGLGVNIKFPANYRKSPYTVIATGVTTLPQCVEFPFSLINIPELRFDGIPLSYNQIFPGWMIKENMYAIRRNESKYGQRNKARRNTLLTSVLRTDIARNCQEAKKRLSDIQTIRDYYTQEEIPGLGCNVLLEKDRQKGISAYSFFEEYFRLSLIKDRVASAYKKEKGRKNISDVYLAAVEELMLGGFYSEEVNLRSCLEKYISILVEIERMTRLSKEKDEKRGLQIQEWYMDAHGKAEFDAYVKETHLWVQDELHETDDLLRIL